MINSKKNENLRMGRILQKIMQYWSNLHNCLNLQHYKYNFGNILEDELQNPGILPGERECLVTAS